MDRAVAIRSSSLVAVAAKAVVGAAPGSLPQLTALLVLARVCEAYRAAWDTAITPWGAVLEPDCDAALR